MTADLGKQKSAGLADDPGTDPAVTSSRLDPLRWQPAALCAIIVIAALARLYFLDYKSGDYVDYYRKWYEFIVQQGGFPALREQFANYNVPYLYLLAAASYLPIPPLIAVKMIPAIFDAVLGFFTYRILRMRYPSGRLPLLGAAVVVLLPTVVLNGSMWGQSDSTYVACAVGGLYYLLRRRHWAACSLFGLALAFKLQVVFLFPILLLLALRGRLPWRTLVAIPGVYLLLDVPALLLGADPRELLLIYPNQAMLNDQFSITTPNVYQFLDPPGSGMIQTLGVVVTGIAVLGLIATVTLNRVELTDRRVVLAAAVSVLLVPLLLPKMHERYFYLADVLTVVAAFWLPRRLWYVPILTQFASLFSYLPFLLLPYRLRELSGNPDIADGSGLTGSGFAEPHTMIGTLLSLGANPLEFLGRLFTPVIDYRILAAATLLALIGTIITATRQYRIPNTGDQG